MKKAGEFLAAACALANTSLTDFVDNFLETEPVMIGKIKYLKRCASTFAAFEKKQKARKDRFKNCADHGYYAKEKPTYRKKRDAEISKLFRRFRNMSGWEKIISKIFPGGHPFFTDETCKRYVMRSVINHLGAGARA